MFFNIYKQASHSLISPSLSPYGWRGGGGGGGGGVWGGGGGGGVEGTGLTLIGAFTKLIVAVHFESLHIALHAATV